MPDSGYRMPKPLRNVHTKTGLHIVHVTTQQQLKTIDAKKQGIIISSKMGKRKKLE